jgi:hypothetical protein
MSKKLIAVASAAALALSALVAAPSVATVGPFNVTEAGSVSSANGTTGDLEHTINVPTQDVLRLDLSEGASTTGTLVRYSVVTPLAGAAISVAAAGGGAKLITATQFAKVAELTSASGATTLSITSDAGGDAVFYVYTTSTSDSTITVSSAGASQIIYLKGVSTKTNAYKLNFSVSPVSTAPSGEITFTGTVTDAFGNLLSIVSGDVIVDGIGGNLAAPASQTDFAQNATTKVVTFSVLNRSTVGSAALSLKAHSSIGTGFTKVAAFGTPVSTQFFSVTAADLTAQVTALTAQVAALTADYNALAAKWNARVASKKAPKKKVATK